MDNRTRIPQNPTEEAAALGLPATLFGFTPNQRDYWYEPGLPWFTDQLRQHPPIGYDGHAGIPFVSWIASNGMAPRFPHGCAVHSVAVFEKKNLVVGRVYLYCYQQAKTQKWQWSIARLVKIGGNYLEVKADNDPTPSLWRLRDDERQAVWDVREVTHYASYPEL
jgi:hypothetical protein